MKKTILACLFILPFFLVTSVSAQTRNPSPKSIQKRDEVKVQIQEKKEEVRNKITTVKRERIMSNYNKMIIRINATIERIETLTSRIEGRLDRITTQNDSFDTTLIKESLDQAKEKVATAKIESVSLEGRINTLVDSPSPKDEMSKIKSSLSIIKTNLKDAHLLLVKVIGDIRGLRVGDTNE